MHLHKTMLALAALACGIAGSASADDGRDCLAGNILEGGKIYALNGEKLVAVCTNALKGLKAPEPERRAIFLLNRCTGYRMLQQLDLALADCNEGLRVDPKNLSGYPARGGVYLDKKFYASAILDYTKAIISGGGRAGLNHYGRGRAHEARGDKAKAIADYRESLKLWPSSLNDARDALKRLGAE